MVTSVILASRTKDTVTIYKNVFKEPYFLTTLDKDQG